MKNEILENEQIKEVVKQKYGEIAQQSKTQNTSSCCGVGGCGDAVDYTVFAENYQSLAGYNPEADLGLGCGLPTEFAQIKPGNTVVDLGSGAGNDVFIARAIVGETGKVIGIDMTEKMIELAKINVQKLGFSNVEFILGEIESIPLANETTDVVVSNCVMNLVPNKRKAFAETFRILKSGGHFSISDIVLEGDLPEGLQKDAEMYAGCVSGAIQQSQYLQIVEEVGFKNIQIQKSKKIEIPANILLQYVSETELQDFQNGKVGIFSITVFAEK